MSSLTDKVIEYLKQHPNAKPREIADYLGVSPRVVRAILTRLRNRGIVVRSEKGYILKGSEAGVGEASEYVVKAERGAAESLEGSKAAITCSTAQQGAQRIQSVGLRSFTDLENRISRIEAEVSEIRRALEDLRGLMRSQGTPLAEETQQCVGVEVLMRIAEAVEALALAIHRIALGDTAISDLVDEALEKVGSATSAVRLKRHSKS